MSLFVCHLAGQGGGGTRRFVFPFRSGRSLAAFLGKSGKRHFWVFGQSNLEPRCDVVFCLIRKLRAESTTHLRRLKESWEMPLESSVELKRFI